MSQQALIWQQRDDLLLALRDMIIWYGRRGGESDNLLPPEDQESVVENAMKLIEKVEATND